MKHIGHTLFGDFEYGGDKILKGTIFAKYRQFVEKNFEILPHQALHAKSLGFEHPTSGESMYFEHDLPENFKTVLDRWRNYSQNKEVL
jgi:23S rRNA pseudouridine1911/1915/1917 synthase